MQYNPWGDAARRMPDVHIEVCAVAPIRGAWVPSERVILLDVGLGRIERRVVLAHEMAHIDRRDHECQPGGPDAGRITRRRERGADELAARRLITLDELADALAWARAPEEAAAELDVTVPVLRRRLTSLTDYERAWVQARIDNIEGAA